MSVNSTEPDAAEAAEQIAMATEIRGLICRALDTRARALLRADVRHVEADKCHDLARIVESFADPVALAAVLGLV